MSTPTNDGGPAFPFPATQETDTTSPMGMSLRDYFAGQALAGICAQGDYGKHPKHKDDPWAMSWAAHAYDYADAMIEHRNKTNGGNNP